MLFNVLINLVLISHLMLYKELYNGLETLVYFYLTKTKLS